ncbi:hypothetical protein H2199_002232 [Coniosporium tulheliwenetii]|uniref:Uncharacterized protein n=1 Tax=Coniosporium tulheliwenetii TaxID=3383036 RepID=A0ACC2ZI89_9PEZI|nr:hypothetical protein H2199_002232 [Cladosporium sp. JES 115]
MFAFIIILLLYISGLPLSVSAIPAQVTALSNHTSTAMVSACGTDWIFLFMYADPTYKGDWHAVCVKPGTCHNVPGELNDKISSIGILGPTGLAYCQLYENELCNDVMKMIFAHQPGLSTFQHLERLDNKVSSYKCFG